MAIEGDAGIGKSTLLGHGVATALQRGHLVLPVRAAEAEARMSFAGLGDMLEGVADDVLQRVNESVRTVLEVVLLRRSPTGVAASAREIGAGVLSVLRLLSATGPVLITVDDVQWLDRASTEVVGYALRRLHDEPVRALMTRRTGSLAEPAAASTGSLELAPCLPELLPDGDLVVLPLGRLATESITGLVRGELGAAASGETERVLVGAADGNPYWALELARAFSGDRADSGRLAVPATLSKLLGQRVAAQPEDARQALLAVSALSRPTWAVVRRALQGRVADADVSIDLALEAGLITETAGRLRPAHPLLGAIAMQELSPAGQHQLHRRLATITADPEQQARHLALANDGEPDAAISRSLEAGARSAQSRGAPHAAAELADLAATLTVPEEIDVLNARGLFAAELHFAAGNIARACELAEEIAGRTPPEGPWASLLPMLIESTYWVRGQPAAQAVVRRVLAAPGLDRRSRAVALACAADVGDGLTTSRSELARESIAVFDQIGDTDPGALSMALVYLAEDHLDAGLGMADDLLIRAEAAETRQQLRQPRSTQVLNRVRSIRAYQLKLIDDLDGARTELLAALVLAHSEGDDGSLPALLGHLALTEYWAGNYAVGLAAVDEGLAQAARTGGVAPASLYAAGGLLAVTTGDSARARALMVGRLPPGAEAAPTKKTIVYQHVLGVVAFFDRDAEAALRHFRAAWSAAQTLGVHEPGRRQRLEADLGQALITAGLLDEAARLAAEQRSAGERLHRPTLTGVGFRLDGLVLAASGELDAAVSALEAAVSAHRRSSLALELPRSQLALGQVHRRRRAKAAARANLQAAVDQFTALGAVAWADLAREDLARLDGARTGATLTATESRVSALASTGHNNREIAAILFISTRTVEGHLAAVYRKLGVRGRTNLPQPSEG